jgi:hypothetical protein
LNGLQGSIGHWVSARDGNNRYNAL